MLLEMGHSQLVTHFEGKNNKNFSFCTRLSIRPPQSVGSGFIQYRHFVDKGVLQKPMSKLFVKTKIRFVHSPHGQGLGLRQCGILRTRG